MSLLNSLIPIAIDPEGRTYPDSLLYSYDVGTNTPKPTYSNSGLSIENANPLSSDGAGRFFNVYLGSGGYKLVLRDKNDVVIWTQDNYYQALDGTDLIDIDNNISDVAQQIPQNSAVYLDSGSANNYLLTIVASQTAPTSYAEGMIITFKPDNSNTTSSTVNVQNIGSTNLLDQNGNSLTSGFIDTSHYYSFIRESGSFRFLTKSGIIEETTGYNGVVNVLSSPYSILAGNIGKQHTLSTGSSSSSLPQIISSGFVAGSFYTVVNYLSTNCTVAPFAGDTFVGTNTLNSTTTLITIPPYSAVIFTVATTGGTTWNITGINGGQSSRVLSAGNIASQTNIDFALFTLDPTQSVGNEYRAKITGFKPATDAVSLYSVFSTDNGATFLNTLFYSGWTGVASTDSISGTALSNTQQNAAFCSIMGDSDAGHALGNAADEYGVIDISLKYFNTGTSVTPHILYKGGYFSQTGDYCSVDGCASRKSNADYNAIRFYLSSEDFTANGIYALTKEIKSV